MESYRLKANSPDFDEVDGSHAGSKYRAGKSYQASEVPQDKKHLFEKVVLKEAGPLPKDGKAKGLAEASAVPENKEEGGIQ